MTTHDFARMLFHRVAPAYFYPTTYDKVPCWHGNSDPRFLLIKDMRSDTTVVELRAWNYEGATHVVGQCATCQKVYYQEKTQ